MAPGLHLLADTVVPLANAWVFVIVQTLFFWFIGAKEVLTVIKHKAGVLADARRVAREGGHTGAVRVLDTAMLDAAEKQTDYDPELERTYVDARNREIVRTWVGPWVVALSATLALVVAVVVLVTLHGRAKGSGGTAGAGFHRAHGYGLLFVLFAYVGEILFFLFVIHRFIVVGDYTLARLILGAAPADGTTARR